MQPPQGSNPQGGYPNGQGSGPSPWDQPPMLNQWVQRPVPGQQVGGGQMPGAPPPPAQIAPDPAMQPNYYGMGSPVMPGPDYGAAPRPGAPYEAMPQAPVSDGPGYQVPKTGMSRPRRSRPKWGLIVLVIAVLALCGFLAAALGALAVPEETAAQARRYRDALYRLGERHEYVRCADGTSFHARIRDVDNTGRLLLENEKGERESFAFKEISFVI